MWEKMTAKFPSEEAFSRKKQQLFYYFFVVKEVLLKKHRVPLN